MTEEHPQPDKQSTKFPENPFFKLVIFATGIFIFTLLVLVATFMGDPNLAVNRLIQKFAGSLITAEVAVILIVGFLALFFDRRDQKDMRKPAQKDSPDETKQN